VIADNDLETMIAPKPAWLRVPQVGGDTSHAIKRTLRKLELHTVCEEARCPNMGACWRQGTATVMLLGDVCTRACRFCAVAAGKPPQVDQREPERVAEAIASLGLRYVVLTMVTRDDLPDGGAAHVAATVRALRAAQTEILIETLVGDFQNDVSSLASVLESGPDVFAHNVEVVSRLTRTIRDARCDYQNGLNVLRRAKELAPKTLTKSSLMVGVGERDEEVLEALRDLRSVGVEIVTIGQYLQPSRKHAHVHRFVSPEQFEVFRREALQMGFAFAASEPLVRSSYRAAEAYAASRQAMCPDDSVPAKLSFGKVQDR